MRIACDVKIIILKIYAYATPPDNTLSDSGVPTACFMEVLVMDVNETYCGDHVTIYTDIE